MSFGGSLGASVSVVRLPSLWQLHVGSLWSVDASLAAFSHLPVLLMALRTCRSTTAPFMEASRHVCFSRRPGLP